MLRNYYKTAVRNIARSRLHTAINVIGLSTGIAFTLLIAAYAWGQWQVNRRLQHADRQYILTSQWKDPNIGFPLATVGQLGLALKQNYPHLVANFYRFDGITGTVSYGDKHFHESVQVGDSTLLSMFGFRLLAGDPGTALNQPFSVVIDDDLAIKYFGKADAVGKDLTIQSFSGGQHDFRVTGVLKRPDHNSITRLIDAYEGHVFIPCSNLNFFGRNMAWQNTYIVNYVELQPGVRPEALQAPIAQLLKQNTTPAISDNLKVVPVALTDFYLSANGGSVKKMLYTLSFIALFILLMAIINFINLSISRSSSRLKEIGIRKVLGGLRGQLIRQFLTESILLAGLATALSLILYLLFAPVLSGILGKEVPSLSQLPMVAWAVIAAFALFVGWLAGLYPAYMLSSLPSVDSLKGKPGTVRENILLRKGLVGFQFATATIALVGAIIISRQIDLFFSSRLGYDKEFVVSAAVPRDWTPAGVQRREQARAEFAAMPEVRTATLSYEIPNGANVGSIASFREGGDSTRAVGSELLFTDEHYTDTYKIPMVAGVYFHGPGESNVQDTMRVVINETEARALGWKDPALALGQRLRFAGVPRTMTVSGVIKDFYFGGMSTAIRPEVIGHVAWANTYRYLSFKLRPGNIATTLANLQHKWATLFPGAPFEYKFMDETLHAVYQNELQLRKAASTATALALIIVLLGVIGLLSLSIQKRTKEIAIRKVIGASVPGIIRLFLREYVPLLLLAGLVASPLAYWIMHQWLNNYVTRITITPWPFAVAITSLAVLMVLLIALQTIRAALANPVKSLKTE